PVILEIGSGKGRFLVESAERNPHLNYIGIEKSLHYFRVIESRLERRKLANARIINYDASVVVAKMIPDQSIHEVHIYFPDPWPRPRERKRRIIREETLEQIHRILEPGGVGVYVTDHVEYFDKAVPQFEKYFKVRSGEIGPETPARTNYEGKYRAAGRAIYQIEFRI
ncbi:MAG TPA: tRNA (guanosine(46)-N7)-methyltransferase TrmB, partial [Thermoanaerobaculia bacterium]